LNVIGLIILSFSPWRYFHWFTDSGDLPAHRSPKHPDTAQQTAHHNGKFLPKAANQPVVMASHFPKFHLISDTYWYLSVT